MTRARVTLSVLAVLALVATAIVSVAVLRWHKGQPGTTSLVSTAALQRLPVKDASGIDTSHLADGLAPPTNKWFSGLALQKTPRAVFPTPLRFSATESSYTVSLPRPTATADSIIATTGGSMTVSIEGATSYQVTRYDELSVDLTYRRGDERLATVILVAGSPYVQLTAHMPVTLLLTDSGKTATVSGHVYAADSGERIYQAVGTDGVTIQRRPAGDVRAAVPAGGLLSVFGLPAGQPDDVTATFKEHATSRITGTHVSYTERDKEFSTDMTVRTADGRPTIFCYLPHHRSKQPGIASFDTIYGQQTAVVGTTFRATSPVIDVRPALDLTKLAADEKTLLTTSLRQEINATRHLATDSYFSGKELYRSAQLLQLARQLDETAIAGTIQSKLRQELTGWLTPSTERSKKYFYYDARLGSIVGETPSFGSEAANDHHFHYGYFIYAAAVLAAYDPEFADTYRADVDLLVADLANYDTDEALPLRRVFDPYFGHSWASGTSPFDDGNNQESVSEALNAWTGIWLWADRTHNRALASQAGWMLSVEAGAARAYWFDTGASERVTNAPGSPGFQHSFVSLNWGGKRDNATFFSAEPNAKLGILLIPMNPTMAAILPGKPVVDAHLREAVNGSYDVQFGDYLLMYRSLRGDDDLLETARALPETRIDGANSRSHMYAWILSR